MEIVMICVLVFLAGFVDAIGGGGGLISLPAYLMAGLPVHNAIATNKLSSSMGTTVTTIRYARAGFIQWNIAIVCLVFAIMGSSLGAHLALLIEDTFFKRIMLIVIPLTACYVLYPKSLKEKEPLSKQMTIAISSVVAFGIGIYDGFYGPGTGTFLLILLTSLAHLNLQQANGITKVINLTTNYSSLIVYLLNAKVLIPIGLLAGAFNMLGNYIGSSYFKKGSFSVKPIMIFVLVIFFVKTIIEIIG
ncbi:sulfite exporter TauE/SafE family protein [Floccifex sp.]|uniref:sulfite exporter TauE/SafE family protein n=1 Tax=Floccifex sp. TaxID=2815810 RepID=UPI003F1299AB